MDGIVPAILAAGARRHGRARTRFAASPARSPRLGHGSRSWRGWRRARPAAGFVLRLSGHAPPPDLAWLGIEADTTQLLADAEQRTAEAVARLKESGRLYPCLESEEELRWRRAAAPAAAQAAGL